MFQFPKGLIWKKSLCEHFVALKSEKGLLSFSWGLNFRAIASTWIALLSIQSQLSVCVCWIYKVHKIPIELYYIIIVHRQIALIDVL